METVLAEMRAEDSNISYLVGTLKARIKQHEKRWQELPGTKVRDSVEVKLYDKDGEV